MRRLSAVSGLWLFPMALLACSDDGTDSSEDPGNPLSVDTTTMPFSEAWSAQFDDQADSGALILQRVVQICRQDSLASVAVQEVWQYQVRDGGLLLWSITDCAALRFNGGHSSLLGEWATPRPVARPDTAMLPGGCRPGDTVYTGELQDSLRLLVTAGSAEWRWERRDWCAAAVLLEEQSSAVVLAGSTARVLDCSTLELESAGHKATLRIDSLDPVGLAFQATFLYGDSSCVVSDAGDGEPTRASQCVQESVTDPTQTDSYRLYQCVSGSGFLEE